MTESGFGIVDNRSKSMSPVCIVGHHCVPMGIPFSSYVAPRGPLGGRRTPHSFHPGLRVKCGQPGILGACTPVDFRKVFTKYVIVMHRCICIHVRMGMYDKYIYMLLFVRDFQYDIWSQHGATEHSADSPI